MKRFREAYITHYENERFVKEKENHTKGVYFKMLKITFPTVIIFKYI